MEYTYKEMRAFAVDFAYYIHIKKLGDLSHEKHKELFDEWVKEKLPQAFVSGRSLLSKTDCTEDVYEDCKEFVERIDNSYLPSINQKNLPENEPNEKECPMNNLIDRLTTMYPLVSSKLDTNVNFGNKVPNIFQQYQSAFRKEGITIDTWYSKNDTFYYVVEHKDGNVYSSEKESNYKFEQTAQMACIEKAFEMCNKKVFEAIPYKEGSENESLN